MLDKTTRIAMWAALAVGLGMALAGLYLIPASIRSPGYFHFVRAHVGLAHLLLPVSLVALSLQAVRHRAAIRRAWRWTMILPPVFFYVAFMIPVYIEWPTADTSLSQWVWSSYGDGDSNLLLRHLILASALVVVGAGMRRKGAQRIFAWSSTFACLGVAWTTGSSLLGTAPRIGGVDAVHSLAAVFSVVAVVLALVLPRLQQVPFQPVLWPLLTAAVLVVTAFSWASWYRIEYGRHYPLFGWEEGERDGIVVARMPATREEMLDPDRQHVDPDLLNGSMACGLPDCHPIETQQWAGSNHRYSADNIVFRRVVQSLIEDKGPEAATACMNCHDPIRVLEGTITEAWADGAPEAWGEGISCIACHAIIEVPERPRNGEFTVRVPQRYPGRTEQERNRNILLDPREHARDMFPEPMILGDEPCATCHRLEVGTDLWMATQLNISIPFNPDETYGPENPGHDLFCNDCHMLVTRAAREHQAKFIYDHETPAVNPDLHLYAMGPGSRDPALAEVSEYTRLFLEGGVVRDPGFEMPYGDEEAAFQPDFRAFELLERGRLLRVELDGGVVDGRLEVHAVTHNHRSAHHFPSGSKDFRQVWQEIEVRDAAGVLLAHIGALDDEQRVPDAAHRLGGTVLDVNGDVLAQHKVWEAVSVTNVRVIAPGGQVEDEYTFELPPDTQLPITVTVRWNLRHASAEFTEFVFEEPGKRFPTHLIGLAEISLGEAAGEG